MTQIGHSNQTWIEAWTKPGVAFRARAGPGRRFAGSLRRTPRRPGPGRDGFRLYLGRDGRCRRLGLGLRADRTGNPTRRKVGGRNARRGDGRLFEPDGARRWHGAADLDQALEPANVGRPRGGNDLGLMRVGVRNRRLDRRRGRREFDQRFDRGCDRLDGLGHGRSATSATTSAGAAASGASPSASSPSGCGAARATQIVRRAGEARVHAGGEGLQPGGQRFTIRAEHRRVARGGRRGLVRRRNRGRYRRAGRSGIAERLPIHRIRHGRFGWNEGERIGRPIGITHVCR